MYSGTTPTVNETTTTTAANTNLILTIVFGILSLLALIWVILIIGNWERLTKALFKGKGKSVEAEAKKCTYYNYDGTPYEDDCKPEGYQRYPPVRMQRPFYPPPRNAYSPYSMPYY